MNKYFFFCLLFLSSLFSFSQTNLSLLGHLTYNTSCSNLTGYADSLGREYALVGTATGLSIVDIDTPSNPHEIFFVPGATGFDGFWREVREYRGYAYVTTEQNSGLVVVNLNYLPDSIQYHTINPAGMNTSHTIFIDENGIGYVNGTDRDLIFLDLNANPYNPPVLGRFTNNYVHDCYARNDTLWAACINDGIIKVIDVSNKATTNQPSKTLASWSTPLDFSHNCWLSDDGNYLFTTDEKPNSTLTCYDVSDLNNVTETDKTQVAPGSNTVIHNTYFLNNYCITSYYTYGITIHDVTRKNNLVEVGSFDTSPNFSGDGFNGAWGVWPYLPSGNIIVSDIQTGLWILKPTYKRAAYLEGVVKDSVCNTLLNNVKVEIVEDTTSDFTNFIGHYSFGTPDSGTYTIRFSKAGYQTRVFPNVNLKNGFLTTINVSLLPVATTHLVVRTVDSLTGAELPFIRVLIQDTSGAVFREISTDSSGGYEFCDFVQGDYVFYAGRWGKRTAKVSAIISTSSDTVTIPIANGYYDDFVMDYGWTVVTTASSGDWERGEPIGTFDQGTPSNPDFDIATDFGTDCYVTGNNGGSAGSDDIDNGYTILRSPLFDLANYNDPYISYYKWFFNDGGQGNPPPTPNDSLIVYLSNGVDSVILDMSTRDSLQSRWVYKKFRVKDVIVPSPNMRIAFHARDANPGHFVEAALDVFMVADSVVVSGLPPDPLKGELLSIEPNPASDYVLIKRENDEPATLVLTDIEGRILSENGFTDKTIRLAVGDLSKGVYIVKLLDKGIVVASKKLVKAD